MRRIVTVLLITIMLFNNIPRGTSRRAFNTLHFRKVSTDFGRKYASNYAARISEDNKAINMTLDLIRDLTVDLWLKVNITQRETKNRYKNIFAYNMNLCQLIGKAKGINVFTIWLQNIYRYTNMPMSCPIEEGQYYWRDLRPDKDSIPAFILTGHFRIDALFYMKDWDNDMLTNTTMFVYIKMK
ncbi:uncharacterized protein LOC133843260 [Drosophila sulfurigaster albostrigata]|uniref:uncharacterized protein LOC133843260 n=1 Tax=Drosophila sulfurigaster albostrigata TaxID=89887 RepID=UPI002D219EC6|nr:uncharacterized protein LOC133843260 [Drosophila sulfurigaster albostrigata]